MERVQAVDSFPHPITDPDSAYRYTISRLTTCGCRWESWHENIPPRWTPMSDSVGPWQEYRRRRNLTLFAFLGYVPFVFIIAVVAERLFHSTTPGFVVAVGWMIFLAVASIRCENFRCPRCRKRFFAKWWYHNSFARRCVHCGLPKYASPGSGQPGTRLSNP